MNSKIHKKAAFFVAAIVVLLSALLTIREENFLYSNLVDNESQSKVQTLLIDNGIAPENTERFLDLVNEFYAIPYEGTNLVKSGWKKAVIPFFSYRDKDGFFHLEQQSDHLVNCRTAAFIILSDSIIFNETTLTPDESKDPFVRTQWTERADSTHYDLLFSDIEGSSVNSSQALSEVVLTHWNEAGIEFSNDNVQLVTVYGGDIATIQNFHAAIAVYESDRVWLLEKYDPIHPYQLSCFPNQNKMLDYMKKRVSGVVYAAVFSNDHCLWSK